MFRVTLECDFFLYNMCRRIVGFMLEYAHGNGTIDILNDLLSGPKKLRRDWKKLCSDHIRTAEAKGLRMDGICYGDRFCVLKEDGGVGVIADVAVGGGRKSSSSSGLYFGGW